MVERRFRLGLSLKPHPALLLGHLLRKDLQRHLAGKLRVFGNVDLAIPPLPRFSRIL